MIQEISKIGPTFTQSPTTFPSQNSKEIAIRLVENVNNCLQNELMSNTMTFSFSKTPEKLRLKQIPVDQYEKIKRMEKLEKIEEEKRLKSLELKRLKREEQIIKKSNAISNKSVFQSKDSLAKSKVSEDIIQKTKRALSKSREFQKELKKKQLIFNSFVDQCKLKQNNFKQMQKRQKCEERKKMILQQRKQLQKIKAQRKQAFEKQKQKLQEIKNRKELFEKMLEDWQKKEEEENQKIDRIKCEIRKAKTVKLRQIDEHQRKYLEHISSEKQRRSTNKQNSKNNEDLPKVYSKYFEIARLEEKESADLIRLKEIEKLKNVAKKKDFGKYVKDVIFPKLTVVKKQEMFTPPPVNKVLDVHQSYKLGNLNMKMAHARISQKAGIKSKENQSSVQKETQQLKNQKQSNKNSAMYKDYLKQLKKQTNEAKKNSPNNSKQGIIQQMQRLLNNGQISQSQKLIKTKLLIQQNQKKCLSQDEMIMNIRSKILVLKEIIN